MSQILVVDDATTVRLYHRKVLTDAGWSVEEAVNGVDALEKVVSRPNDASFQLYVVDVNMPRMDGYAFVRELRRMALRLHAPVLMVSTQSRPSDAFAARDAGANAYLVKPADPTDLTLTVALLLGDAAVATRAAAAMKGSAA
jgi:two-component system chemotaxis response regulator CheY